MSNIRPFTCVVAADQADGIGQGNDLPWPRLPTDLRTFKRITCAAAPGRRNALIMGRLTWDSVPAAMRPLPDRQNVVVSRSEPWLPAGVWLAHSLGQALTRASADPGLDRVFVIGGGQIYAEAFHHPACVEVILTRLAATFPCDTFIPPVAETFTLADVVVAAVEEAGVRYQIERWTRT
ncbi:MAG: dihydrofolate reductase [Kofleriaceae bacterium]